MGRWTVYGSTQATPTTPHRWGSAITSQGYPHLDRPPLPSAFPMAISRPKGAHSQPEGRHISVGKPTPAQLWVTTRDGQARDHGQRTQCHWSKYFIGVDGRVGEHLSTTGCWQVIVWVVFFLGLAARWDKG
jgi:hypothetical protein